MLIDTGEKVTQEEFGVLVGVTQQAVSDLIRRGVIARGEPVGQWLLAYSSHLREQAAGRAASGELDLAGERAGLARAQRERIELQNAVTRGELGPMLLLEQVLSQAAGKVAGLFDSIPGRVRRRVPELPATAIDLITREIAEVRNIVASMSLDDVLGDVEEEDVVEPMGEPS